MTGRLMARREPVPALQLRQVPLARLARPAPADGIRVPVTVVRCSICGAPVRAATDRELLDGLLIGVVPDLRLACLFCGPRGVRRRFPPTGPVEVCLIPRWTRP